MTGKRDPMIRWNPQLVTLDVLVITKDLYWDVLSSDLPDELFNDLLVSCDATSDAIVKMMTSEANC